MLTGGGGGNPAIQQGLMSKLQQIVQSNRLEAFYPPQRLQQLVDRLQNLDFRFVGTSFTVGMCKYQTLPSYAGQLSVSGLPAAASLAVFDVQSFATSQLHIPTFYSKPQAL